MAKVECPRCGAPLPDAGTSCPRCPRDAARVGDATLGRIEQLADGWALPVRNDRVGDAHIVREVRTQSELELPPPPPLPPGRGASIGSVLASLELDFDGDEDGNDRRAERAATRPLDRAPLPAMNPGTSGPRAPTLLADVNAVADDSTREFDQPPPSQATVPPLPPPPAGPPPRGLLDLGAQLANEPWERPESSSVLLPTLGRASGTPAPSPPFRPLARATPADPTMLGLRTEVLGDEDLVAVGTIDGTEDVMITGETETTVFDPQLPVHDDAPAAPVLPAGLTPRPSPPPIPRASTPSAIAAMTPPRAPTPSFLSAPARPVEARPLALRPPGLLGDVRYLFAVGAALLSTRPELATIEERLALERAGKRHRLVETAKLAVAETTLSGAEIDAARERLAWHEGQRAQYAAAAQAAEDEAHHHDEERAAQAKQAAQHLAELGRAAQATDARLRPLEKERGERRKAIDGLAAQIAAATRRSDGIERKLAAAQDAAMRAGLEAELAAARAERQLLTGQAPAREAALRELDAPIAAERAERQRLEAEQKLAREAAARAEAHLAGAAKDARLRAERERAAGHGSEVARDAELEQLGQVLERERPAVLRARFRAVDEHNASIGQLERRAREIEQARAGIDRRALARGMGIVVAAVAVVATALALLLR